MAGSRKVTYEAAEEVATLVRVVSEKYRLGFPDDMLDRIVCVFMIGYYGPYAGRVFPLPSVFHAAVGIRYALGVKKSWWVKQPESRKSALILHELLHVPVSHEEFEEARTLPHDVDDFKVVIEEFGLDWNTVPPEVMVDDDVDTVE